MDNFEDWVGRSQTMTDRIDPARSNALDRALGGPGGLQAGDAMPHLHHWLNFWDVQPPALLGADGHPAKGGFLPPVPLPRRMWAGGRLTFHKPLALGAIATKTSTITAISQKDGRSGRLVFVTVLHELDGGDGVAVREEQDLVYRAPEAVLADAKAGAQVAAQTAGLPAAQTAPPCRWHETVAADPVMLFRYSALTMNGHRIHYDRNYAITEEAYPALVVHGPLQATLMMRLAKRHLDAPITSFDFRGQQPAFDGLPLHICAEPAVDGAEIWTQQGEDRNMVATARTSAL